MHDDQALIIKTPPFLNLVHNFYTMSFQVLRGVAPNAMWSAPEVRLRRTPLGSHVIVSDYHRRSFPCLGVCRHGHLPEEVR